METCSAEGAAHPIVFCFCAYLVHSHFFQQAGTHSHTYVRLHASTPNHVFLTQTLGGIMRASSRGIFCPQNWRERGGSLRSCKKKRNPLIWT